MSDTRYVTGEDERYRLYRLCECTTCGGRGKEWRSTVPSVRCQDCRGEGRIRELVATASDPQAVGVALITLALEGEWDECPIGILDTQPPCPNCGMDRWLDDPLPNCPSCSGTGIKQSGTWLVRPWLPSARNVSDAGRTLRAARKETP